MKILALEQELKHDKIPEDLLREEAARIWELQKNGAVREIFFTKEKKEAVLLLESGSVQEAEELLANLPLVTEGYIRFIVKELVPYDGYERLFK
ncbi:superoxide dismutase [Desulfospira joergensenii]|uniref:superoxide dismutase n=1 Tax=Desulfospira joergensenii TaxID=53329 RepID=UPI0013772DB0|nr:superoxide dismutase [Desulfospira joergensenii]